MRKLHKTFCVVCCRTVLTGLVAVYLFYTQTKKPSKGHKGTKTERSRTSRQVSRVWWGVCLEDAQRVSYRATVCSAPTSCSLFTLVSLALPKRWTETQSRHSDKAGFYERFHSEVANRLQDTWGDHMLQSVSSFCLSPLDTVAFYSTSCPGQADPAWLACRWPHGPKIGTDRLGVLLWTSCWWGHVGSAQQRVNRRVLDLKWRPHRQQIREDIDKVWTHCGSNTKVKKKNLKDEWNMKSTAIPYC